MVSVKGEDEKRGMAARLTICVPWDEVDPLYVSKVLDKMVPQCGGHENGVTEVKEPMI